MTSEEKGLFRAISGLPRWSSDHPEKGEKEWKRPISRKGGRTSLQPPFVTPPFGAAQKITQSELARIMFGKLPESYYVCVSCVTLPVPIRPQRLKKSRSPTGIENLKGDFWRSRLKFSSEIVHFKQEIRALRVRIVFVVDLSFNCRCPIWAFRIKRVMFRGEWYALHLYGKVLVMRSSGQINFLCHNVMFIYRKVKTNQFRNGSGPDGITPGHVNFLKIL